MRVTLSVPSVLVVLVVQAVWSAAAQGVTVATNEDADADSGPAVYVVVLEHENERQCSASLISLRTAVTTATCARGDTGAPLWALASLLLGAAPPVPPALLAAASRRVTRVVLAGDGRDPFDPALDFAVVELEEPFGEAAHVRPVFHDAERDCDAAECYVQRTLSSTARRARFLVARVAPAADRCASSIPHWAATQTQLLCFAGDELCERDVGGGVVCAGRLCGALSSLGGVHCAHTFAAQRISRWRRFLRCALNLGLCGRGTCAQVCTERRLLQDDFDSPITLLSSEPNVSSFVSLYVSTSATSGAVVYDRLLPQSHSLSGAGGTELTKTFRSEMEFEPNRADFKVTPSRTSRVGLKAGEYGDNAAEYGADEPAAAPTAAPAPAPAAPVRSRTRAAAPAQVLRLPPIPSSASHIIATTTLFLCIHFNIIIS